MGRRRSVAGSAAAVGTWGSVEEAREVLRSAERTKADLTALVEEGERHDEELLYVVDLLDASVAAERGRAREAEEAKALVATFEDETRKERELSRSLREELRAARAEVAVLHQNNKDLSTENADLEHRLDTVRRCLSDAPGAERLAHLFDRSLPMQDRPPPPRRRPANRSSVHAELSDIYDQSTEASLDLLESDSQPQPQRRLTRDSHKLSKDPPKRQSRTLQRPRRSKSVPKVVVEAPVEPSAPPVEAHSASPRRLRSGERITTTVEIPADGSEPKGTMRVETVVEPRRSLSEGRLTKTPGRGLLKAADYHRSMATLRSPRPEASWLPTGTPIADKAHTFTKATSLRPEACHYCEKRIHFGSKGYRCEDCRYVAHQDCREWVPKPCVPRPIGTPGKNLQSLFSLSDLAPPSRPRIPAVLIHCVTEMDRRGYGELGLYRVPGMKASVVRLVEGFLGGRTPELARVDDVQVLCSAVKNFLSRLRDPLVPTLSLRDFSKAAAAEEEEERTARLDRTVTELPVANRDTLAFLVLHWRRVAAHSEQNRMPEEQLARVLAPTVFGSNAELRMADALEANQLLITALHALLCFPDGYWEALLELGAAHPLLSCPSPQPSSSHTRNPLTPLHAHSRNYSPTTLVNSTLTAGPPRTKNSPFFSKPNF